MSRKGKWALALLLAIHVVALLPAFFAPYDYAEQHRDYPLVPPMRLHFWDVAGHFHVRPFVADPIDSARHYPLRLMVPHRLIGTPPPGVVFLLGTDAYGRDILSRLLYGARISLFTGLLATLLSLGLGLTFGMFAGYFGGWTDQGLMRTGELFLALPWLYLLLAVRAFLPLHTAPAQTFLMLIIVIGTVGWVRPARLVRSVVLSAKERDFVTAARGFGASNLYLIRRHILPLTAGVLITQATVLIPQYIVAEISLSFLGLGIGEPVPSWGNMLTEGMQYHSLVSHPWLLLPGVALIPVLLSYLILADSLLDRE